MSIRTLLIGLDGATFSVLDPLMQQGVMPFLRSFFEQGVKAELETIVPALTPPAWTSLMTGRRPGQHGVFDFFRMESPDSRHVRFFTSHDVQCDTIWSLAAEQNLRVTCLNFPATFPAPKLPGYVVPGWVPWRQLRLACWPADLFDQLQQMPGFNPRELGMDIKLEERATEGCANQEEYGPWIQLHIRRERNWFEIARSLTATNPSPLTAVLFDGVDKLQHLCWRFLRPEDDKPLETEREHDIRRQCLEYFRGLDAILADLCQMAGPEANVILASDHGFGPTKDVFYINAWLAQQGYLAWANNGEQPDGALLGVGKVARHTWMIDWTKTIAFTATPTSNGIYIVLDRTGTGPGVKPAAYEGFRRKLIDELKSLRHPATGEPVVTSVWTKDEVFAGPHRDAAPDMTLGLRDGGLVSILPSDTIVGQRPAIAGAHRPMGVFGARGPAIRRGLHANPLSILDIAPLVMHSLGLPVPAGMEGRMPEELFEADALKVSPVRIAHAAAAGVGAPVAALGAAQLSEEDEQIVMERLRELGYVE